MTRKDYVEVAKILNTFEKDESLDIGFLMKSFIEMFKSDNPRFDANRFTTAVMGDN